MLAGSPRGTTPASASTVPTEPLRSINVPFREETPSPHRSQPLGEIAANSRSPSRLSQGPSQTYHPSQIERNLTAIDGAAEDSLPDPSHDDAGKENHDNSATAPEPVAATEKTTDLTRTMSEIIARRQTASHSSNDIMHPRRRKDRKLGRAPSGSNGAIAFTRPTGLEIADSVDTASPMTEDGTMAGSSLHQAPMPSQQLSYDAPGAEEHRRLMSKKMGMKFVEENTGRRVESLGLVKDAEVIRSGVGDRVRGRHRDVNTK